MAVTNIQDDWQKQPTTATENAETQANMAAALAEQQKAQEQTKEDAPAPIVDYFREMEIKVQSHLGRKVEISGKGKKKSITLYYEDNEDLDELLKSICGDDFLED